MTDSKKQAEREAFFDYYKQNAEPLQKKVYAIPEAYKTEHQEEQDKHIKESVEAAVKDLEKTVNKDWMYQQRERNELGADYFSYQGYHPPKK